VVTKKLIPNWLEHKIGTRNSHELVPFSALKNFLHFLQKEKSWLQIKLGILKPVNLFLIKG